MEERQEVGYDDRVKIVALETQINELVEMNKNMIMKISSINTSPPTNNSLTNPLNQRSSS